MTSSNTHGIQQNLQITPFEKTASSHQTVVSDLTDKVDQMGKLLNSTRNVDNASADSKKLSLNQKTSQTSALDNKARTIFNKRVGDEIPPDLDALNELLEEEPALDELSEDDHIEQEISNEIDHQLLEEEIQEIEENEDVSLLTSTANASLRSLLPSVPVSLNLSVLHQLAQTNDPTKSTQMLLIEVCQGLQSLYPNANINLKAEVLSKQGQFELESYTLPHSPNSTYYKAKVNYTVEYEINGHIQSVPIIQKELFTTATQPDLALVAMTKYNETIQALVDTALDLNTHLNIEGLPSDTTQLKEIINQHSFQCKIERNKSGKLTSSSLLGGQQANIELKVRRQNVDSLFTQFAYDKNTGQIERSHKSHTTSANNDIIYYSSEEEALSNMQYMIKNENLYQQWQTNADPKTEIKNIKKEIKEKEQKVEKLQALFIKKSRLPFKKGNIATKEFETFLRDLDYQNPANQFHLSSHMNDYLTQKEELQNIYETFGKNQQAEIASLQTFMTLTASSFTQNQELLITNLAQKYQVELSQPIDSFNLQTLMEAIQSQQQMIEDAKQNLQVLRKAIKKEHKIFIRAFQEIQNLNKELKGKLQQLQNARTEANQVLQDQDPNVTQEEKKQAKAFLKAFSDKEVQHLTDQIKNNHDFIANIRSRLPTYVQSQANIPLIGVGNDITDLEASAYIYLNQNDLINAENELKQLLQANPYDVRALTSYAKTLFLKGDIQQSEKIIKKALDISPQHVFARNTYGSILLQMNRLDEAEKELKTVLDLPDSQKSVEEQIICLNHYGEILRLQNKWEEAIQKFENALEYSPLNEFTLTNYANTLIQAKKYSEAEQQYLKLLNQNPNASDARLKYAQVLVVQNNYMEAKKQFEDVLKLHSDNAAIWTDYAQVLLMLGEKDQAIQALNQALDIDSHFSNAQKLLDLVQAPS